jgi:hypothetical protein
MKFMRKERVRLTSASVALSVQLLGFGFNGAVLAQVGAGQVPSLSDSAGSQAAAAPPVVVETKTPSTQTASQALEVKTPAAPAASVVTESATPSAVTGSTVKAAEADQPLLVESDSESKTIPDKGENSKEGKALAEAVPANSAGAEEESLEAGLGIKKDELSLVGEGSILAPQAPAASVGLLNGSAPQVGAPAAGTLTTADGLSKEMMAELGATFVEEDGKLVEAESSADGIIVVDSDETAEIEAVVKYENLPTDEGKTRIKSGAKFPVVVLSQVSSKTAKKGDPLEARLKYDLKIGDRLIARKGSVVNGHINYALGARSVMHSLVSHERWYRNSGCLGFQFDEILNDKGEHIPLVACPAQMARIVKNKGEGRELGVNHAGQISGPWAQQLRYKALRIGLNAAMAPAGVFSFGAMPVALGVLGAANPSFAFMRPVGTNVRHRRLKGFAWGFLSGVPGSWLIEDTVVKGQEAIIKPGDEFLAEFKEEFTGEAATEAQLMPNAKAKVHGDVRKSKDTKDSKDPSKQK